MSVSRTDVEFLFNAAAGFHQAGNLQRASELYERVLSLKPNHIMTLNNQALIARALGRLELSLSMLEMALQLDPANFEVLANLGRVSLQNNQPADAEHYLKRALKIKERDTNLGVCLGKALYRQGKIAEAKRAIVGMLSHSPENFDLIYSLGLIAADQNDEAARDYFMHALRIRPGDQRVLTQLDRLFN